MKEIIIYGGIAVNIVGALYLMASAVRYYYTFRHLNKLPFKAESVKERWAKIRLRGFALMILGVLIAVVGCMI